MGDSESEGAIANTSTSASHEQSGNMSRVDFLRQLTADFRVEGEVLGLSGKALTAYVCDSLKTHKLQEQELHQKKQIEYEKHQHELALQEKMKRLELEQMMRLEGERLALERTKLEWQESVHREKVQIKQKEKMTGIKPKIPYWDEKTDDMESYLRRFESYAEMNQWESHELPCYLSALLKGKALTYFQELSEEDAKSFVKIKKHLLGRFQCTEEGFRAQFRSARPDTDEPMTVFLSRVRRYFSRWTELADIGKNFDKLVDLLLREQILSSLSSHMVAFLMERQDPNVDDMVRAADRYREAHKDKPVAAKHGAGVLFANVNISGTQTPSRGGFSRYGPRDFGKHPPTRDTYIPRPSQYSPKVKYERKPDKTHDKGHSFNIDPHMLKFHGEKSGCWGCNAQDHGWHYCKKLQFKPSFTLTGPKVSSVGVLVGDATDATLQTTASPTATAEQVVVGMSAAEDLPSSIQTCRGTLDGKGVTVMLDSGCSTVGVRRSLLQKKTFTDRVQLCRLFNGEIVRLPVALVSLDCPYFSGTVEACVIDNPVCDVILGRIAGSTFHCSEVAAVAQTRAQTAKQEKPFRPLLTAKTPNLDISPEKLSELQRADPTLTNLFQKIGQDKMHDHDSTVAFVLRDSLLYRRVTGTKSPSVTWQVVVPESLRESVLIAAHDSLFGGHMGSNSTFKRIYPFFFWPGYRRCITEYCRSCDTCQKMFPKGRVPPAPLQPVPVVDVPFSRVAIDLVGPISPPSTRGHKYILTCVDIATRYPEAVALRSISTEAVAEALVEIFSRTGIPDEVLSDQGTQFTSETMHEVMRLLSVSQLHSTPYHPQTNGVVERFNGTLKAMLKRVMVNKPKDWDRYLPAVLFAYREIPNESTGFAPFELLYGRIPKGPSQLLYDSWTGTAKDDPAATSLSQYVSELRDALTDMVTHAQNTVKEASKRNRHYKFRASGIRSFKEGSQVLVLLPSAHNKMLLRWRGPFKVLKRVNTYDYLIETSDGMHKLFHINLLREYIVRTPQPVQTGLVAVIAGDCAVEDVDIDRAFIKCMPTSQTEDIENVVINPQLSSSQKHDVFQVMQKHTEMLTDMPGKVDLQEHSVTLTKDVVVHVRQYPLPFESEVMVKEEVEKMLSLGVIEPSSSPFSSPVVMVRKKDGSTRFCIDFRELNKVTQFDAEPIPDTEALFSSLHHKHYFTKIDLAKGYWQIPMAEKDKEKTAFQTPLGLFHFTRMPFGMSTAPSSFARMMRRLNLERFGAVSFFDDILIASTTWQEHLQSLDSVFQELSTHGLTARPSKVEVGFTEIEFLGHIIGGGSMRPQSGKVSKILSIPPPSTKKQVRSLLGLVSFYRRYIPNYASTVTPLTNLTKTGQPNKVKWTEECQKTLDMIKAVFSSEPVVRLPDFGQPFTVKTDASSVGLGAVLMQYDDDGAPHPILYASRKLLDRETRYSTVERECLGLVWAVDKFHRYLFGRHFFVETDHRPLTYLKRAKTTNGRLMRWALAIQDYNFTVMPISGSRNVEADMLSRIPL